MSETRYTLRAVDKLTPTLKKANKEAKGLNKSIEDVNETSSKKIPASSKSFTNLGSSIMAAGGAIMPIAGGIMAVAAAGVKMNNMISDTNNTFLLTKSIVGDTNEEVRSLQTNILSLSKIYGDDFRDVLISSNTLSKEFGISSAKALDLIEKGYLKGANANGEFTSTLKEFSSQLGKVGIDAEEFITIISQQVKEGIYSDKGIDAIKEAGIRIREMTPATEKALSMIGISGKELKKELNSGTITMMGAIKKVSKEMGKFGDNSNEVGAILADVFGGAGEDAGIRNVKMLADMNTELSNAKDNTNEFKTASDNLTKSWDKFTISATQSESLLGKFFTGMKKSMTDFIDKMTFISRTIGTGGIDWLIIESAVEGANNEFDKFTEKVSKSINKQKVYNDELNYYIKSYKESKKGLEQAILNDADAKIINAYKEEIKELSLLIPKVKGYNINKNTSVGSLDDSNKTPDTPSSTSIKGNTPMNINISIGKLIESFDVSTTSVKEGYNEIKEMVSRALIDAVNDVNLAK